MARVAYLREIGPTSSERNWTPVDEEDFESRFPEAVSQAENGRDVSFGDGADVSIRRHTEKERDAGYVLPEEHSADVDWPAVPMSRSRHTDPYAEFKWKAPVIVGNLKRDFNTTDIQGAGAAGNLGHESDGFRSFQEMDPTIPRSKGGWGWAQWTGLRRRAFEAYAAENKYDPSSDAANYGYLKRELETTYKNSINNLKKQQTLESDAFNMDHIQRV